MNVDWTEYNKKFVLTVSGGGPLQWHAHYEYYIAGVVSFGIGCVERHPSVYTKVSSYLDFIGKHVWNL
jgi:secreted trypsin-like serine protease